MVTISLTHLHIQVLVSPYHYHIDQSLQDRTGRKISGHREIDRQGRGRCDMRCDRRRGGGGGVGITGVIPTVKQANMCTTRCLKKNVYLNEYEEK